MKKEIIGNIHDKNEQKQALIDMMRGDEEIGLLTIIQKNNDMSYSALRMRLLAF